MPSKISSQGLSPSNARRQSGTFASMSDIDVYSDAKVLLSVRSAESWARSMSDTIKRIYFGDSLMRHLALARYKIDLGWAASMDLMIDMNWAEGGMFARTEGEPGPMMEA
jgi:hypothetical protein